MHPPAFIDAARAAFVEAFKTYAQEGNAMRDLLMAYDNRATDLELRSRLQTQQDRLNQARRTYEHARTAYVRAILQTMNVPSQTDEATTDVNLAIQRPRRRDIH